MARLFFVYWIRSGRHSYVGATVDPDRRLRQHNRLISGGAKRTRGGMWSYHMLIYGFRTWREALQFEWALKHTFRRCRTIEARNLALETLLSKPRWTRNSPLATEVPLLTIDQSRLPLLAE